MKVITIKQPWASLIVEGYKEFEFRSWKTKYRGKILIHAGKSVEKEYLKHFEGLNIKEYPLGKIIGEAYITDCISVTEEFEDNLIKENKLVYGKTKGRAGYAFKLENIKKVKNQVKINGMLGLWNYDEV